MDGDTTLWTEVADWWNALEPYHNHDINMNPNLFPVERFDPSAADRKATLPKGSTESKTITNQNGRGRKRKSKSKSKSSDSDAEAYVSGNDNLHVAANKSDSSSVPSSSDEENNHSSTTLKVIAPSQPVSDGTRKRDKIRGGTEDFDEAIDDFDADFDIIESGTVAHASMEGGAKGKAESTTTTRSHRHNAAAIRALRLSQLPISEVASEKHWNLPPFLLQNLNEDSYEKFFPIQCMVIPDVIESERNAHIRGARDVCCHAPTGSGKTLAFVIPLLTALYNETATSTNARGLRRLRALVVLPGRDLAKQVCDVFVRYAKGSSIKIGLAVGGGKKRTDLINERRSLVVETYHESCLDVRDEGGSFLRRRNGGLLESASARTRHSFDPTSIISALDILTYHLVIPHSDQLRLILA